MRSWFWGCHYWRVGCPGPNGNNIADFAEKLILYVSYCPHVPKPLIQEEDNRKHQGVKRETYLMKSESNFYWRYRRGVEDSLRFAPCVVTSDSNSIFRRSPRAVKLFTSKNTTFKLQLQIFYSNNWAAESQRAICLVGRGKSVRRPPLGGAAHSVCCHKNVVIVVVHFY